MKYWNIFFLYSIAGHLFETIINLFSGGESGILYGFWTPIYGIGVLTILAYAHFFRTWKHPNLALFLSASITLSLFEWVGGTFLESVMHEILWDYSKLPGSIGRYVSIEVACVWGLLSILLVKYIHPFVEKIQRFLPNWWTYSMIAFFFVDLLWTILMKVVL